MIDIEQKHKIEFLLNGKNLPLDLKLEILDHMMEQVDYKMGFEGKDFSNALDEIKESWKEDFRIKKTFIYSERRTKILRDTIQKTNVEILKKASLYIMVYFFLSIFLITISKIVSYYFHYIFFISLVATFLMIVISDFKTIWSCRDMESKKISYLQKGVAKLITYSFFIVIFILRNFNLKFEKYYNGFQHLIQEFSFSMNFLMSFIIYNLFIFIWIQGFFYYLEYKKTLKYLEQKINFKL